LIHPYLTSPLARGRNQNASSPYVKRGRKGRGGLPFEINYVKIVPMLLYINTIDKSRISVGLKDGGKVVDEVFDTNPFGSQVLLPIIEKILEKNGVGFKDLTGVEVETGPGSFTGVRVGVSVANALGFSLGILVNGKKMESELNY
jgi:hypothetical protein